MLAVKLSEIAKAEATEASAARAKALQEAEVAKRELARAALVNDAVPTVTERAISTLPFLLPLLDGAVYGRFLLDGPAQVTATSVTVTFITVMFVTATFVIVTNTSIYCVAVFQSIM
jgi:hypothetical protein